MTRPWTFYAGLGALTLAGTALAGGAGSAAARITVLDDDAAAVARAIAPRPDGSPGLRLDDTLVQLPSSPTVLPSSRVAARVPATSLLGQGADGMAEILSEGVRDAGFHRVFVDDVGPAFAGQEGDDLAQALAILSKEHPWYAPTGVSLRVHLYVAAPGPLFSSPAWAGARTAVTRSSGVWLKTFAGARPWNAAQWLAWPAEAGAQLVAAGSSRGRVHVLFGGGGGQPAAWSLGRTGSACNVLGNGPGGYRLGASVDAFVSEYRRTLPITAVSKVPVVGCTAAPALTDAGARALAGAAARELTGLAIPPGGLVTPPLPAGQPAQLTLQLGADPLGLAAGLGVSPEAFWTAAQARLEVRGPGIATDVTVAGDGAARMEFTPTSPGPVTMRLVIDHSAISRTLGEAEIVGPLHAASVSPAFIRRVVADPSGWQLTIPLVQPGGAPGSPVLEIVPPTG